jgi:hypothetical protein
MKTIFKENGRGLTEVLSGIRLGGLRKSTKTLVRIYVVPAKV